MKRGYFLVLFTLFALTFFYTEPLNAQQSPTITGNAISNELRSMCSNNLDDEGSHDICQTGFECETVTGVSGKVDCNDPVCFWSYYYLAHFNDECPHESNCNDNQDNDGDGAKDCADHDCDTSPACTTETTPQPPGDQSGCRKYCSTEGGIAYLITEGCGLSDGRKRCLIDNECHNADSVWPEPHCKTAAERSPSPTQNPTQNLILDDEECVVEYSKPGCGREPEPLNECPPKEDECADYEPPEGAFKLDSNPTIEANYFYEDLPQKWEFKFSNNQPSVHAPKFNSGESSIESLETIKQDASTENCDYYIFTYQRIEFTQTFDAQFTDSEQISPTQKLCNFLVSNEIKEQLILNLLGDNPLQSIISSLNIPEEITAYEGTSEETDSNENSLKSEIIKTGQCPENSEQKSEFTDSQGNQFKLCIETESFNPGDEYITDSYIEEAGDYGCLKGGDYQKSGQEFVGSEGESYYLCIKKQSTQTQGQTIL
jgi:hypothetical protein